MASLMQDNLDAALAAYEKDKAAGEDMYSLEPKEREEGAGFFSTLYTAVQNLPTDVILETSYLVDAITSPIETGEAILRVAAGYAQKALPDDWERYLPEDWATNKEYANAINEYYIEKYGSLEKAADSLAEQPVSVALDVFAVKSLLTAISKQATKTALASKDMANTAKGTVMEGELASRAASDAAVVREIKKTERYEGTLVWDEAIGAHVPASEVTRATKIDGAEAAKRIDDIEATRPTNAPAVAAQVDNIDDFNIVRDDLNVVSREDMIALANATKETRTTARKVNEDWMDTVDNPNINSEIVYAETVIPAKIRHHEANIAHMEAAMANTGRSGADSNYPIAIADEQAKIAALSKDASETLAIQGVDTQFARDNFRGDVVSKEALIDSYNALRMPDMEADGMMAATRNQTVTPALAANMEKIMNDNARMNNLSKSDEFYQTEGLRQGELFTNANAAAYEAYQASRLANEVRAAAELSKAQGAGTPAVRGMLVTTPETKLAKLSSVESKITDRTPVKKQEFAPVSPPKNTNLQFDAKKVLPAIQRVSAAANQNQLIGDRDIDGSLIPIAPDKGIDLRMPDMPPYEKSIDNRDITGGKVNTKPGWFQGVSPDDDDDGNYWSADFEDEHWNTPAGVQEAIGIWGRPIGNRIAQNWR